MISLQKYENLSKEFNKYKADNFEKFKQYPLLKNENDKFKNENDLLKKEINELKKKIEEINELKVTEIDELNAKIQENEATINQLKLINEGLINTTGSPNLQDIQKQLRKSQQKNTVQIDVINKIKEENAKLKE